MFIHIYTVHLFGASDGCRSAVVMDVQCVLCVEMIMSAAVNLL